MFYLVDPVIIRARRLSSGLGGARLGTQKGPDRDYLHM